MRSGDDAAAAGTSVHTPRLLHAARPRLRHLRPGGVTPVWYWLFHAALTPTMHSDPHGFPSQPSSPVGLPVCATSCSVGFPCSTWPPTGRGSSLHSEQPKQYARPAPLARPAQPPLLHFSDQGATCAATPT